MKQRRNTRQRALVKQLVQARRDHPSANEVYREARALDPTISRATVYRNLNLLAENGEIRHVSMTEVDRFDWRVERHYHLQCTGCGAVVDAPLPYRPDMDLAVSEQTGYRVAAHRTTFEGLCPACQKAREGAPG
ncbi:MAG: transcriptional repressor [Clostridiales bacterium]|nr:transcriptional repressor [Clostridiales bacterium]